MTSIIIYWCTYTTVFHFLPAMSTPKYPHNFQIKKLEALSLERAWHTYVEDVLFSAVMESDRKSKRIEKIGLKQWTKEIKREVELNINHSKSLPDEMVSQGTKPLRPFTHTSHFDSLRAAIGYSLFPTGKEWVSFLHNFLRQILKSYHGGETKATSHISNFLEYGQQRSWAFVRIANTTIQFFRQSKACITFNTITLPLGRIVKHENCQQGCKSMEQVFDCDPCFISRLFYHKGKLMRKILQSEPYFTSFQTIIFTLDKQLKLRLEFHTVRFEFLDVDICNVGNLQVKSELSSQVSHAVTFCGIFSNIPVYPPHKNITITMSVSYSASHIVLFSFEVISSQSQTRSLSIGHKTNHHKWSIILPPENKNVDCYFLETDKYNVIHLTFSQLSLLFTDIYDGPGVLSQKTHITSSGNYTTSSFKCQIVAFSGRSREKIFSELIKYKFFADSHFQQIHIQKKNSFQLSYPGSNVSSSSTHVCKGSRVCVLEIHADSTVNISIKLLQTQFGQSSHCEYSGVAMYTRNNKTNKLLSVLLCSHEERFNNRNFFIKGPTCLLVLYMYPEYDILHTKLVLSTTQCSIWYQSSNEFMEKVSKSISDSIPESEVCWLVRLGAPVIKTPRNQYMHTRWFFHVWRSLHITSNKAAGHTEVTIFLKGYFEGL